MKTKAILIFAFVLQFFVLHAQISNEIFGVSPLSNELNTPNLTTENWGVAPSQQNITDMWGREVPAATNNYVDVYGNPILTDANGNIVYDNAGNPMVDSSVAQLDSMIVESSSIAPPDDPVDVPLDNGTAILLGLAVVVPLFTKKNLVLIHFLLFKE